MINDRLEVKPQASASEANGIRTNVEKPELVAVQGAVSVIPIQQKENWH